MRPDPDYPRDLSLWEGALPAPDDVTVSHTGGRARAPGGPGLGGPVAVGWWGASTGHAQLGSPAGPQFWSFQDRLLEGAARPHTELGLPPGEEVDAVFSWPLNGKTCLIRGRQYWR